jgi:phospholipid transport system substrate-binding protein
MKKILVLIAVAMSICVSLTARAQPTAPVGTPMRAIQELDAKLDDYKTGPNLSEADKEFNRNLKKDIIHGTFDIRELCQLSLGKHWNDRTDAERNDFVQLMTDLLEKRAILSKEQGQKKAKSENVYSIKYIGDKFLNPEKTRALDKTQVYVKSEDIKVELNYKLKLSKNTEWKIFDVIVDGASLLDNYKYQFDSIIKKGGYQDLTRRMKNKLNSMNNEK